MGDFETPPVLTDGENIARRGTHERHAALKAVLDSRPSGGGSSGGAWDGDTDEQTAHDVVTYLFVRLRIGQSFADYASVLRFAEDVMPQTARELTASAVEEAHIREETHAFLKAQPAADPELCKRILRGADTDPDTAPPV